MVNAFGIAGLISFVILLILNAYSLSQVEPASSVYFMVSMSLGKGFPLVPIGFALAFGGLIYAGRRLARIAGEVMGEGDKKQEGRDGFFVSMYYTLGWLIACGTILGLTQGARAARGCPINQFECQIISDGLVNFIFMFINILIFAAYVILWTFFLPAIAGLAVGFFPVWLTAAVALGSHHPAASITAVAAGGRWHGRDLEGELAELMDRQDAAEVDIERVYRQLSPLRRLMLLTEYRKRLKDARELKALAQAAQMQREALRTERELANSIHELERLRRMWEDRR